MTGPIEARSATLDELPTVLELVRQAHDGQLNQRDGGTWALANAAPVTEQRLRDRLADGLVVVGTVFDVPLGVTVARLEPVADGLLAVVEEIHTHPDARGVGVGRHMIEAVESWARAAGCIGIDSLALPGDRATKNFFEAAGLIARAIVVHRSLAFEEPPPHRWSLDVG